MTVISSVVIVVEELIGANPAIPHISSRIPVRYVSPGVHEQINNYSTVSTLELARKRDQKSPELCAIPAT